MSENKLTLLTDFYELTMMQGYYKKNMTEVVVFDAFYRENPSQSGYAICCGLQPVIDYIKNLTFDTDDIAYLRSLRVFDEEFLEYLANFKFSGDIYAIPKSFKDLTDIDFSVSYISSEMSDIELSLSITKDLSDLEKCILYDILEYGTVISREHHTRLRISRYQYEKIRRQLLDKIKEIY